MQFTIFILLSVKNKLIMLTTVGLRCTGIHRGSGNLSTLSTVKKKLRLLASCWLRCTGNHRGSVNLVALLTVQKMLRCLATFWLRIHMRSGNGSTLLKVKNNLSY